MSLMSSTKTELKDICGHKGAGTSYGPALQDYQVLPLPYLKITSCGVPQRVPQNCESLI